MTAASMHRSSGSARAALAAHDVHRGGPQDSRGGLSGPSACLGVALPNVPAVTALGPVGVDLEPVGAGNFDGLADVALTPRERLALRRLPSEQRSSAALT
jgi:hypothetical protein